MNSYTRAELIEKLGLNPAGIDKVLARLNSAGVYGETGRILANGRQEKVYRFDDLPKKWKMRLGGEVKSTDTRTGTDGQGLTRTGEEEKTAAVEENKRERNWLGVVAASDLMGRSERTVRLLCRDGKLGYKLENGNYMIALSSFDEPTQRRWVDQKVKELEDDSAKTLCLRPEDMDKTRLKEKIRAVAEAEARPANYTADEWCEIVGQKYNVSRATIYNWIRSIKGMRASENVHQISDEYSVKIASRTTDPEAVDYLISLFIHNERQTENILFEYLQIEAERNGWKLGSEKTLYRILRTIREKKGFLETYGKAGRLGLESEISPAIDRNLLVYGANELVCGDQHIFDTMVFDDDFNPIRPQMYMFEDMGSRYWGGASMTLGNYNSYNVAMAMKQMSMPGIPGGIYTDNGKSELSKYIDLCRQGLGGTIPEGKFAQHLADVKRRLHGMSDVGGWHQYFEQHDAEAVAHYRARGRWPRTKPIENHFMHLERMLFGETGGLGYCKRQLNDRENEALQKRLALQIKQKKLMHWKEYFEMVYSVINDWNNHLIKHDNIIPQEHFFNGLRNSGRPVLDSTTLDYIFLPGEIRKVHQSKVTVKVLNETYTYHAPELASFSSRHSIIQEVMVKVDPLAPDRAYILNPEGKEHICVADVWDKVNPKSAEELSDKIRKQKEVMAYCMNFIRKYSELSTKMIKISEFSKAAAEAKAEDTRKQKQKEVKKMISHEEFMARVLAADKRKAAGG